MQSSMPDCPHHWDWKEIPHRTERNAQYVQRCPQGSTTVLIDDGCHITDCECDVETRGESTSDPDQLLATILIHLSQLSTGREDDKPSTVGDTLGIKFQHLTRVTGIRNHQCQSVLGNVRRKTVRTYDVHRDIHHILGKIHDDGTTTPNPPLPPRMTWSYLRPNTGTFENSPESYAFRNLVRCSKGDSLDGPRCSSLT